MKTLFAVAIMAAIILCGWMGTRIINGITFNQNCGGYLARAANANTVEIAERELARALEYMERNELTGGYTSVLWRTPDEDVAYWYNNTQTALSELRAVKADSSPLEKSNMLMKLRETLLDRGEKGDHLTAPDGISVYPNNAAFFWWGWLSFGVCILALIGVGVASQPRDEDGKWTDALGEIWDSLPKIDREAIADTAGALHRADWKWSEMDNDMRRKMGKADRKNMTD
jgi:hypothetical protein